METFLKKYVKDIPDFPKEGIIFKDISPILENNKASVSMKNRLLELVKELKIDGIVGVDSRGFLFGNTLAMELEVPFFMVRKKGKLPDETIETSYALEYGEAVLELHKNGVKKGMNILIHDDLLATGGTAEASAKLVKKLGANVSGFLFLVNLQFLKGEERLKKYSDNILSAINY